MRLEELRFPVLTISQGVVLGHVEPETFAIANRRAVKAGHFDGMWVVDSTGKAYVVRGYDTVSLPFWKPQKEPVVGNFLLDEMPIGLDDVRRRAITCIEENPELYEGTAFEVSELVDALRRATSMSEILAVFSTDGPGPPAAEE